MGYLLFYTGMNYFDCVFGHQYKIDHIETRFWFVFPKIVLNPAQGAEKKQKQPCFKAQESVFHHNIPGSGFVRCFFIGWTFITYILPQ